VIIMFSGHRDKVTERVFLEEIATLYCDCLWIHGGARGFDDQVEKIAKEIGIRTEIYLPDYEKYGRCAPIMRNKEMLEKCSIVIACYDGRKTGGTFFVVTEARRMGKNVIIVPAVPVHHISRQLEWQKNL